MFAMTALAHAEKPDFYAELSGFDDSEELCSIATLLTGTKARSLTAAEWNVEIDPAVGTFTITIPASELRLKWVACFRLVVTIPEERPNGVSFAMISASS